MSRSRGNAEIVLPEPGEDRRVAMSLYAARTRLYVRILDEVARRPGIRYSELQPLVGRRSKNVLTKALRRLQRDGVLTARGMGQRAGYELTAHGVAVRDAIVEYRALDRLASARPGGSSRPASA